MLSRGATAEVARGGRAKRGSTFSDKQFAFAAKDRKPVRVMLKDEDDIFGWPCGMDDFHWGVVDSNGNVHLVHKSVPALTILHASSPPPYSEVEEVAAPFRDYVMRTFFSAETSPATP